MQVNLDDEEKEQVRKYDKKKERWTNVTLDALDERDVFLRMCGVDDPFILTTPAFRLI